MVRRVYIQPDKGTYIYILLYHTLTICFNPTVLQPGSRPRYVSILRKHSMLYGLYPQALAQHNLHPLAAAAYYQITGIHSITPRHLSTRSQDTLLPVYQITLILSHSDTRSEWSIPTVIPDQGVPVSGKKKERGAQRPFPKSLLYRGSSVATPIEMACILYFIGIVLYTLRVIGQFLPPLLGG